MPSLSSWWRGTFHSKFCIC